MSIQACLLLTVTVTEMSSLHDDAYVTNATIEGLCKDLVEFLPEGQDAFP